MQPVTENLSLRSPLLEHSVARNNNAEEIVEILDADLEGNLRSIGNPNPDQREIEPSNYVETVGVDQDLGYFRTSSAWEGSEHDFFIPYYENNKAVIVDDNQQVFLIPDQQDETLLPHEVAAVHEAMEQLAPEYGIPATDIASTAVQNYTGWDQSTDLRLSDQVMDTLDDFVEDGDQEYLQSFVSTAYRKAAHPDRAMDRLYGSNVEQINGHGYAFTWNHYPQDNLVEIERLDELENIYNSR